MFGKRRNWQPEDVIASQLAMNAETWKAMQAHGVDEGSKVRLDFFYEAPDRDSANDLAAFLTTETDYDVRADTKAVAGSTQPTTISREILDQWVKWMVLAGHENGRCKFDGWGAAVPKSA